MIVAIATDLAMPCLAAVSGGPIQDGALSGWAGWVLLAAVTSLFWPPFSPPIRPAW